MKIVYLYKSLAVWGGVERILVDKMNFLAHEYGEDVYIITSDQGNHPVLFGLSNQVHFIDLNIRLHTRFRYNIFRRQWEYLRLSRLYHKRLNEQIERIKPDLLVCTTIQMIRPLLNIKGSIPLVVESHINFTHPDTFWQRVLLRWNNLWVDKADALVTLTEGDAENWRRVCENVHVIPNMVHLNDTNLYSDCTAKRVLFVGRFEEQKNIGELINIWQLVHSKHPDWRLDLYGDGALWEKYKQEADALNINIEVHKPSSQIMDVYRRSSIFVLLSLYEPFGLVIPEAMSCGLPVVTYDSPYGPSSIISDGEDGFLIPIHGCQAFADRLCQLMSDEELRKEMGKRAIASSQRFSADQIMPMWKELFEQLTFSKNLR
ncbi:MAG: glycosyltransferase family 4 protein [Prevotella sp.]|nr:glycosyltransferase family 4 protein [Prevotella sp.]